MDYNSIQQQVFNNKYSTTTCIQQHVFNYKPIGSFFRRIISRIIFSWDHFVGSFFHDKYKNYWKFIHFNDSLLFSYRNIIIFESLREVLKAMFKKFYTQTFVFMFICFFIDSFLCLFPSAPRVDRNFGEIKIFYCWIKLKCL